MKMVTVGGATVCLASRESPRILWKLEVTYCIHKNTPNAPILSHTNPGDHPPRPISSSFNFHNIH
jgi:hypothetical protein